MSRLSFPVCLVLSLMMTLFVGCKSTRRKGAGQDGYNQLVRSQQQAMAIEQLQQPSIYFHGPVQKPVVPWRENITLAEALLEAGYTSTFSPHSIRVSRQGRTYNIDVHRLLRGTENPVLVPGDVVEVIR